MTNAVRKTMTKSGVGGDKQSYLDDIKLTFDALRNYGICLVLLSAAYYLWQNYSKMELGWKELLCISLAVYGSGLIAMNTYWYIVQIKKRSSNKLYHYITTLVFVCVAISGFYFTSNVMATMDQSGVCINIPTETK